MGARAFGLALILGLGLACGDPVKPEDWMLPESFTGDWRLQVQAQTGCWSAFTLFFRIEPEQMYSSEGPVVHLYADWSVRATFDPSQIVSGTFDIPQTHADLKFYQSTYDEYGHFEGEIDTPRNVRGTFTAVGGAFGREGCTAAATAFR